MPGLVKRLVRIGTGRRGLSSIFYPVFVISNIAANIPAFADLQSIRRGKVFAQANLFVLPFNR
jgi:hypothetical protein